MLCQHLAQCRVRLPLHRRRCDLHSQYSTGARILFPPDYLAGTGVRHSEDTDFHETY